MTLRNIRLPGTVVLFDHEESEVGVHRTYQITLLGLMQPCKANEELSFEVITTRGVRQGAHYLHFCLVSSQL